MRPFGASSPLPLLALVWAALEVTVSAETIPAEGEGTMVDSTEEFVRRQVLLREINERIVDISCSWTGETPEFLCECTRTDCTETLALTLPEYERLRSSPNLFVIVPGHESPEVDRVVEPRHTSNLVEKTKHLELVFSWGRITQPEGVSANEQR